MQENLKPLEEHGFLIVDFTPEDITLNFFRFNPHQQTPSDIDELKPFRVTKLVRPA